MASARFKGDDSREAGERSGDRFLGPGRDGDGSVLDGRSSEAGTYSPFRDEADRTLFWAQVVQTEGCWLWMGRTDRDGYGLHRGLRVPRAVLEEVLGRKLAPGEQALHACDNPPCARFGPKHVHLGSAADNGREKAERGRAAHNKPWSGKKLRPDHVAKLVPGLARARSDRDRDPNWRGETHSERVKRGWEKRKQNPDWREAFGRGVATRYRS